MAAEQRRTNEILIQVPGRRLVINVSCTVAAVRDASANYLGYVSTIAAVQNIQQHTKGQARTHG